MDAQTLLDISELSEEDRVDLNITKILMINGR